MSGGEPLAAGSGHGERHRVGSDEAASFPEVVAPAKGVLAGRLGDLAYDLGWAVTLALAGPWLLWRTVRSPQFRRMLCARFGRGLDARPRGQGPRVLVHGVSVGEVKAARSVVEELETRYPNLDVVISTTTETGHEVARSTFAGKEVVRFPADLSWVVRRFLARVDPDFVILVELEVWPNFLRLCNREGRPVAVINGRITSGSHARYLLFRWLVPQFRLVSLFCVQSPEYAERFQRLSVDPRRILVTGNVKVDGLRTGPVDPGPELRRLLGPRPGQPVLVAGSTHEPEERWVVAAWREHCPSARLILVPRHPDRCSSIAQQLALEGVGVQRLSALRGGAEVPDPARPVLVDTIGELERVYGLADVVFVGGSLIPHGGQNVLEPAGQGRATVFGPHFRNFRQEAGLLLEGGAARTVPDVGALGRALQELFAVPGLRERMGAAGVRVVEAQRGAARTTADALSGVVLDRIAAGERLGPPQRAG